MYPDTAAFEQFEIIALQLAAEDDDDEGLDEASRGVNVVGVE